MRTTIATTTAALLLVTGAGAAGAAPPSAEYIDLECDNGHTYSIWTHGNGGFTPGHLVGGPGVVVPIAFLSGGAVAVTPDGEVLEFDFGSDAKGTVAHRNPRPQTTCSYETHFTFPYDDPETGLPAGTEVTFSGEVLVQLPGR